MPKVLIVVIVAFVIAVYVYTFIKVRKRRKMLDNMNSVEDFKNRYKKNDDPVSFAGMDFIEKDEYHRQIQEELGNANKKPDITKVKRFKF